MVSRSPIRTAARAAVLSVALVAGLASTAPAVAQSKKELVNRVLTLQQPGVEALARQLAEQPAVQLTIAARQVFERSVPADKRESVAKAIDADLKKYTDEVVPILRERAIALAPSTIGAELETNFSEAELKQVIAYLESPVVKRFLALGPNFQRTLGEKLVAETRSQVEPRLKTLEAAMANHLGLPPGGAAAGGGAAGGGGGGGGGGAPLPGNRGATPGTR